MSHEIRTLCDDLSHAAAERLLPDAPRYRMGVVDVAIHDHGGALARAAGRHLPAAGGPVGVDVVTYLDPGAIVRADAAAYPWHQRNTAEFSRHGLRGTFHRDERRIELYWPDRALAVRILADWADLPPWDETSPLVDLGKAINAEAGAVLLHGATLGIGKTCALMSGPGGSGKSVLTLAGLRLGMTSVGDDYAYLRRATDGGFEAHAYSLCGKQTDAGLRLLGLEGPPGEDATRNWQGKHVFPIAVTQAHPLRVGAHVAPILSDRRRIVDAPAREMFAHLVHSTVMQLQNAQPQTMAMGAAICRAVPNLIFEMDADPVGNARYLRDHLAERFANLAA